MFKALKKDALSISIMITVGALMTLTTLLASNISTVVYILASGAVGLGVYYAFRDRKKKEEPK
jgi:hypothetical protein